MGNTESKARKPARRRFSDEERAKLAANRQATALRERQVIELRLAGRTFEQIAVDLGFKTKSAAFKAYERVMRRIVQEPADVLRALSEQRLDSLRFAYWTRALGGDVPAGLMVLRIERQLADLRGLNAPKEIDLRLEAREIAQRYGLDEEDVLAEAQRWLKETARR